LINPITTLSRISTPVDATWPQTKKTAKERHLSERSGDEDVDSKIEVKLEEDGGGSTEQSWK